jgi:hypothetical protein
MYLAPIAGRRFGRWGRRAIWVVLIAAMVILAELDLRWLRDRLEQTNATGPRWYYEAVYAAVFLAVGYSLVRWRVLRRASQQGSQPDGRHNERTTSLRSNQ